MKKILIHGSGHKADSWRQTVSHMAGGEDILCPELSALLRGRPASFENLSAGFAEYCGRLDGPLHLCGLSLGGILALDYALRFPAPAMWSTKRPRRNWRGCWTDFMPGTGRRRETWTQNHTGRAPGRPNRRPGAFSPRGGCSSWPSVSGAIPQPSRVTATA